MKIRSLLLLPSDAALVRRALRDRPEAFEALVLRHERRVRAVLLAMRIPSQEAPDLIQQTFLQAFRSLSGLRRKDRFGTWLLQIARNLGRRRLRSPPPATLSVVPDSASPDAPDPLEREDLRLQLWRRVGELPEDIREAIFLYYHDGESVRGVARALGISASAVKMRLKRGRDILREALWVSMEEWLREMLPSARDRKRSARALSLLVLSTIPVATRAGVNSTASGAAARTAGGSVALGGIIIMTKKLALLVTIVLSLLLCGLFVARDRPGWRSRRDPELSRTRAELVTVPDRERLRGRGGEREPAREPAEERPIRSITGRILDEDDQPVARARIRISGEGDPAEIPDFLCGDDGAFELPGLTVTAYHLQVNATGHWPELRRVSVTEEMPVLIRLRRASYLAGRVYLRDRHHPLRSGTMKFWMNSLHGAGGRDVESGPEGEFTINPLESGEHLVTFTHPGFRPINREMTLTVERPAADLEIIFEEGITVRGTVWNRAGEALPFARLEWRKLDAPFASRVECCSDRQGRFEAQGLEGGDFRVVLGGFIREERRRTEVNLAEALLQERDLTFEVLNSVLIQVLDPRGRPAEGAQVRCRYEYESARGGGSWTLPPTPAEGFACLYALPGNISLAFEASAQGMGSSFAKFSRISEAPRLIVLHLLPLGRLVVKVFDEGGNPSAGAMLVAFHERSPRQSSGTNAAGECLLDLAAGEWAIEVQGGARPVKRIERIIVEPGKAAEPLIVAYSKADVEHLIRGRVVDAQGDSISRASISFRLSSSPAGDPPGSAQSDSNGWFIAEIEDGEYTVEARADGLSTEKPVRGVRPGGPPLELRLVPTPGRSVSGVVFLDGEPYAGARLRYFVTRPGEEKYQGELIRTAMISPAASEDRGAFELPRIAPALERIIVTAQSKDFAFARSGEIALPAEGRVDGVRVIAAAGADFELEVVDSPGRPVPDVSIKLQQKDASPPVEAEGTTGRDGSWRIRRLPPGRYRISARSGTRSVQETVQWTLGGERVTLPLPD